MVLLMTDTRDIPEGYKPKLDNFVITVSDMILDVAPLLSELGYILEWERDGYKVRIERKKR